jgi:glycosyltransferase involved in cell wall biosynthesis
VAVTLSVVLITKNEELNIREALQSVAWADEIIVLDSGSTDQTVSLAKASGARVYEEAFTDFSTQKNKVISYASCDWILLIDADERVPAPLAAEIQACVRQNKQTVYAIARDTFFFGRRLRFSGTRNDAPLRLFPRGKAHYFQSVHEQIQTALPVEKLKNTMPHYSTRDREHYQRKLDCYLPLEIKVMLEKGRTIRFWDAWLRPVIKFMQLYFLQAGILDGKAGFQYAYLSAYYVFLKYSQTSRKS